MFRPKSVPFAAIVTGLAVLLAACTSSARRPASSAGSTGNRTTAPAGTKGSGAMADCGSHPNTCNSDSTKPGGTVQFVLGFAPTGWNILAADSASGEGTDVMENLLPGAFGIGPDLKPYLMSDVLSSANVTGTNPQTVVYQIKPDAVWNDGASINIDDFRYAWQANDPTTCPKCGSAYTAGYKHIKTMTGTNGGKTVTVTFDAPYAEWQSLFQALYPAHIAARHGGTTTAAGLAASFKWFDTTQPTYSGGPYLISSVVKGTSITEVPNPKWYGAVRPALDQLIFRVITDRTAAVTALRNREVQAIYISPTADMAQQVANISGINTYVGSGLSWEHLDFNEKNPLLGDKQLRLAIFTAIDRQAIIARTIGQFVPNAQPLNSHVYFPGQSGYQDNVTKTGQGSGDVGKAGSILTAAGYTGVGAALKNKNGKAVNIRCSYLAGDVSRQQVCEIIQAQLAKLGITATPTTVPDLGDALSKGNFDLIDFSWLDIPFPVYNAQSLFDLAGGVDFGSNNDPAMEALLARASTATDPGSVQSLLNQADVALTDDAYNLPLYQRPTLMAAAAEIANIRGNSAQGPPYNAVEWGLRGSS